MKKIRSYFWLLRGIYIRYRKMILTCFFGGLILFILGVKLLPPLMQRLQEKRTIIGMVGAYTPTDLPLSLQRLISYGLTDVAIDGTATAGLAYTWEVAKDGKEYVFKIKDSIYWHDGKKFTAYDVNYNLRDVEFTPVDETTLQVKLKDPFTPLPTFLSKPLFRKGLVGLSNYKIGKIHLKGEHVSYLLLQPVIDDGSIIEVKFYPTETLAETAFKLGEVNTLDEITDASTFSNWKNIVITETKKTNQYVGVFFNLEKEFLKKKEIRQALSFAIEKPEIGRVVTPLSSESWAYTTRVKSYDTDSEQAKKLVGNTENMEITLSTFQQFQTLAQRIASAWESLGIKTKIKIESGIPQQFDALLAVQEIPSDPDQYTFWHSTQGTNITRYSNQKIDKLLEDGRQETDSEKRKKIYFDFQRYLVEDAPAVFLFNPTTYTISRK